MGDWSITIHGTGPHHNGKPIDAENIADDAVQTLIRAGHRITDATFVSGSRFEIATNRREFPTEFERLGEHHRDCERAGEEMARLIRDIGSHAAYRPIARDEVEALIGAEKTWTEHQFPGLGGQGVRPNE